jgi:hypothetical protein
MACPVSNVKFQLRNGTTAQWNANPILAKGEPGYDIDLHILKIGDGVTHWADLTPVGNGEKGEPGPAGLPGSVGPMGPAGPIGNPINFNGGKPDTSYEYGPVLNCGNVFE